MTFKIPTSTQWETDTVFSQNRPGMGSMKTEYGSHSVNASSSGPGLTKLGSLDTNATLISRPARGSMSGNAAMRMVGDVGNKARSAMGRRKPMAGRSALKRMGLN